MSRRLLIVLVLAAAFLVAVAAAVALTAHEFQPDDPGLGIVVLGVVWIATGLFAWHRRPGSRVGLLMTALGLTYVAGQLYWDAFLPSVPRPAARCS